MIRELISQLYNAFRQSVGTGAVITLFFASILILVQTLADKDRGICGIIISPLASVSTALSQLYSRVINAKYEGKAKIAASVFAVCILALVLASSGTSVFSNGLSTPATSAMHLPEGLRDAAEAILADSEDPHVLTVPGWGLYLRAYSSRFSLFYEEPARGDSTLLPEEERVIYDQLAAHHPNTRKLTIAAKKRGCTYLLFSDGTWPDVPVEQYGYEILFQNDRCTVYKEVTTP